jgi:hypothetical protein
VDPRQPNLPNAAPPPAPVDQCAGGTSRPMMALCAQKRGSSYAVWPPHAIARVNSILKGFVSFERDVSLDQWASARAQIASMALVISAALPVARRG